MKKYCLFVVLGIASGAYALDMNRNGMSDVWEGLYHSASLSEADLDGDGASNLEESRAWTDPSTSDAIFHSKRTAGSSQTGELIQSPIALNSDTDALSNLEERQLGTDPERWDSDGDKVADDQEFIQGSDPLISADTDADGLPDDWERWIIHAAAHDDDPSNDGMALLDDVKPTADFDNDGVINSTEYALGTSPVEQRRNIVIFLTEDQSYHLGCLGTKGLDTPNLDKFGANGVIFERTFCLGSVCSPSKMGLFTGTYPHMNSTYRNVLNYGTNFPLPEGHDPSELYYGGVHEDLPTLVEIFRDRGYFTAISHKTHVQPIRKFPYHKGYGDPTTPDLVASYIDDALKQAGDRPLFFLLNVGGPHLAFRRLPILNDQWSSDGGLVDDGHVLNVDANNIEVPYCYPDVPGVRQDIADYYGSIEVIDSFYGAYISSLADAGAERNTLTLFTSDHGIGLHRAKQSIYGAGLQVPFLVAGAGVASGIRNSEPISHLDIAPTLLEFAGIPTPPSMLGESLWPILNGSQVDLSGRETVLTGCYENYDARAVCDGRYYYIRTLRQVSGSKLRYPQLDEKGVDWVLNTGLNTDQYAFGAPWYNRTFSATEQATHTPQRELLRQLLEGELPKEELYDISNDLWMTNNLVADPALQDVVKQLRTELVRWRRETGDYALSHTEMIRRTERFVPEPSPPELFVFGDWEERFDGKYGTLNSDTNWITQNLKTDRSDFWFGRTRLNSPRGGPVLATYNPAPISAGQNWKLTLETGFNGMGIIGGAVCGYQDNANYYAFQIQDLTGPDTGAWLVRFVRRAKGSETVLWQITVAEHDDDHAVFEHGKLYRLSVEYSSSSNALSLSVLDPESPDTALYTTTISDLAVITGRCGLITENSTSTQFDNFTLHLSE